MKSTLPSGALPPTRASDTSGPSPLASLAALVLASTLCSATLAQDAAPKGAAPPPTAAAAPDTTPTLARLRASGRIAIGARPDGMPFAYLDAEKRPIGYGIDVCNEIVKLLQRQLKLNLQTSYVPVTAATRQRLRVEGKVDLECGLTVDNPDRRKTVAFALPYYFAGPRILTRSDSGIADFFQLGGKRVVSTRGANAVPILRERMAKGTLPTFQLVEAESNDKAFAMLHSGEADAFVTTDNLLYAYRADAPDPKRYRVVGNPLVVEPVAIMLRKYDPEFKAAVDRALTGLMLDGVVGRLYTQWFLSPIPPRGITIDVPMSALLRDQLRWPTEHAVGDGPK